MTEDEPLLRVNAAGQMMKVTYVTEDGRGIFGISKNGEHISITASRQMDLNRGDVVIYSADSMARAPGAIWPGDNRLADVIKVSDDEIIIDDGVFRPRSISRPEDLDVHAGNTIEFNELDGILRVVDSESLSRRAREGVEIDPSVFGKKIDAAKRLSFKDFGGSPQIVEKAREFIETPLIRKDELEAIGARPVRGVLFTGPPGTGKTHLARIIAHTSGAEFYLVNGPELVTKYLGDSESMLRRLFARARTHDRAIIFFDEIDSIASRRDANSHEASNRLVTQFLTEMDGYEESDRVIVIGATNRVDELDPALRRPGRFDWEIEFTLPSTDDRYKILELKTAQIATTGDLRLELVASLTDGWSGADIDLLLKDASLIAAGARRRSVSHEDLVLAVERLATRPRVGKKAENRA